MDPDRVGTTNFGIPVGFSIAFPIYMDPDRVGTQAARQQALKAKEVSNLYGSRQSRDNFQQYNLAAKAAGFQFIWIPTESGQAVKTTTTAPTTGFQFIWIPTESGQYIRPLDGLCRRVSNLYGSRQSRDIPFCLRISDAG